MMSFGFGIFHFSAAFAPKEVKSVVEMLGISSDASKALQELSNTVEIGEFASMYWLFSPLLSLA